MIAIVVRFYDAGYARGYREGLNDSAYEQDFAYQHDDYVKGYWDGFKAGMAAGVGA